jgi:hypothetical protein
VEEYVKGSPCAITEHCEHKVAQHEIATHDCARVLELLVNAMAQGLDEATTPKEAVEHGHREVMGNLERNKKQGE